jgi:hypothetical protein
MGKTRRKFDRDSEEGATRLVRGDPQADRAGWPGSWALPEGRPGLCTGVRVPAIHMLGLVTCCSSVTRHSLLCRCVFRGQVNGMNFFGCRLVRARWLANSFLWRYCLLSRLMSTGPTMTVPGT